MKKIAIQNYGCKLNFSEGFFLFNQLKENGFHVVEPNEKADIFVLNTCSVTQKADNECKYKIRKIKRTFPNAKIIVIGCFAQLQKESLLKMNEVNMVLGADKKFHLLDEIKNMDTNIDKKHVSAWNHCNVENNLNFHHAYSKDCRTRAFVKIQDGCNYKCSFCTIPMARGKSRSDTIKNTLKNILKIDKEGYKEIILTGINLGDFGYVVSSTNTLQKKYSLLELLQKIDETQMNSRIRLSSIEPNLLSEDIINLVSKSKKFVPHFHIPLQSGSDKILRLMKRRYNTNDYKKIIDKIYKIMPFCGIGIDVIVGFPGETEEDFQETYTFLQNLSFSYLHVFTYSERENTKAKTFSNTVPIEIRKKRNSLLKKLSDEKYNAFLSKNKNSIRPVLIEKNKDGILSGYTDNYIKVNIKASKSNIQYNTIVDLKIF